MRHDQFKIGMEFYCGGKRWRCTDIGTRVIVAICLEPHEVVMYDTATNPPTTTTSMSDDPSWFNGPPYAVVEDVFDEYDLPGCHISPDGDDMDEKELEQIKRRWQNPSPAARAMQEKLRRMATTKRAALAREAHAETREPLKIGTELHRINQEVGGMDDLEIPRDRHEIHGADFGSGNPDAESINPDAESGPPPSWDETFRQLDEEPFPSDFMADRDH